MDKMDICKNLEAARRQAGTSGRLLHDAKMFMELGDATGARDKLLEALREFHQLRITCSKAALQLVVDLIVNDSGSNAGQ